MNLAIIDYLLSVINNHKTFILQATGGGFISIDFFKLKKRFFIFFQIFSFGFRQSTVTSV